MNELLKALGFVGLILLSGGCATVVDAQASAEPELAIRPTLQLSPRADLMYQLLAAELAGKRDQPGTALNHYQAVARVSDDPRVTERAAVLALLMKDNAAALELAQRWLTLAPGNEQAEQSLALALLRNGRLEEAAGYLETVRRVAGKKDQQQGYATIAALLGQADDKKLALQVMSQFRDRNPRSSFAQYYHATLAMAVEERQQALASLNRALAQDPKLAPAYLLRTRVLLEGGDPQAAIAGLANAVDVLQKIALADEKIRGSPT